MMNRKDEYTFWTATINEIADNTIAYNHYRDRFRRNGIDRLNKQPEFAFYRSNPISKPEYQLKSERTRLTDSLLVQFRKNTANDCQWYPAKRIKIQSGLTL